MSASICRVLLVLSLAWALAVQAQEPDPGAFSQLMELSDNSSGRISSFDRSGGNIDLKPIQPGETLELANLEGTGIIRHLYFSILGGEHYLRDLVLRAYWDGQEAPCVEVPFGDFFGLGHERPRFYTSLMVTVNPGDLGVFGTFGFNSYFPMPFANGARLTLTNEGTEPVAAVWYHVEFEKMRKLPPGLARFHATWNRVNKTRPIGDNINVTLHEAQNATGDENYVLLDATGHGTLAGIILNIDNSMGNWYGEGDDMIFIDGEAWPPSYHGTGSEEIFGGGACPSAEYAGPYTGFHLIGNLDFTGKVSMYRWYINDPVRFKKSIRMTIEHGHANNIANDYSSTAFWYQDEPHKKFRPLPPAAERHSTWGDDPHDQAYMDMMSIRLKALGMLFLRISQGIPIPDDLREPLKFGISQAYFERDYPKVHEMTKAIGARIDELVPPPPQAAAGEGEPTGPEESNEDRD